MPTPDTELPPDGDVPTADKFVYEDAAGLTVYFPEEDAESVLRDGNSGS